MSNIQQILAENVKYYRKAKKMHQSELAEKIGIDKSRISRIENAQIDIGVQTIEKIANGLQVQPSALFFDGSSDDNSLEDLIGQSAQLEAQDQDALRIMILSLLEKSKLKHQLDLKTKKRLEALNKIRGK